MQDWSLEPPSRLEKDDINERASKEGGGSTGADQFEILGLGQLQGMSSCFLIQLLHDDLLDGVF